MMNPDTTASLLLHERTSRRMVLVLAVIEYLVVVKGVVWEEMVLLSRLDDRSLGNHATTVLAP